MQSDDPLLQRELVLKAFTDTITRIETQIGELRRLLLQVELSTSPFIDSPFFLLPDRQRDGSKRMDA